MDKKIILLPLLLMAVMAFAETNLSIVPISGAEQQYAVKLIGKIQFSDNIMYLYDKSDVELGHTAVAQIDKILFNEIPTSLNDADTAVRIYPNPATESIIISGITGNQTVRIFDLQGKLVSSFKTNDGNQTAIPVIGLQNGTYLLQVGAEIIKFIKHN